ncbi:hypothetical protein AM499_00945 [Bacillus sp. FJAT-22090]|uniref:hypothetical protein n=1 Tax=Bacillus sp. FJAT-22090 TaxID=1581038 RepID=UPI0006AF7259|nr:hypothetical protein [Bacillus sp. FJAT-22090]ALC84546.1 hypothetical protein AM499_00945 [Bacillus sp. FJAT-22090]
MRKINPNFLESVKRVTSCKKLNSKYIELLLDELDKLKIQEIIGSSDLMNSFYELFDNELPFIKEYYVYGNYPVYPQKIVEESEVLITADFIELINSEVTKINDVKSLIPILITYKFLGLSYDDYNLIQNIDSQIRQNLKNELVLIVKSLKSSISKSQGTYSDLQFVKSYEEGTKAANANLIYEFVEAVERGTGFHAPAFIPEVVMFLLKLDCDLLVEGLNEKQEVLEIILLLNYIEFQEKIDVLTNPNLINKWCLYELFRQILNESQKIDLSQELIKKLSFIFLRIAKSDISLYKEKLLNRKYDKNFILIFANTINGLEKNFIDVYIETLQLNTHSNNLELNRLFLSTLIDISVGENAVYLFEKIYYRWIAYLEELYENEAYISDLVYTDYYYCVLHYLMEKLDKNTIYEELTTIIDCLDSLETTWKKSATTEQSHFFIYITRLYTLSIIYKEKNIKVPNNYYKQVTKYTDNPKLWLKYFNCIEIPSIFKEINNNLDIKIQE